MTAEKMDPIILGHNQFFGVDHLSHERGAERDQKFSDINNVTNMIRFTREQGVDGMMMSTHPRALEICDALRKDKQLAGGLRIYPVLPYIAKYVRMANEKGLTNVVADAMAGGTIGQKISTIFKGATGKLTGDLMKMIETLIDMEMMIFNDLDLKAVFLHQALTDLCLGLDLQSVFHFYEQYIPKRFNGALPAYCTYQPPYLLKKFHGYGIENPVVMAPFNKVGYQMCPDLASNEKVLREGNLRLVAMGTLAGGFLKPREAYEYLFQFPNVESVVVGVSTEAHARETFDEVRCARKGRGLTC